MTLADNDMCEGRWNARLYFDERAEERTGLARTDLLDFLRDPALCRIRIKPIVDVRTPISKILEIDREISDQIAVLARIANRPIRNQYLDLDSGYLALVVELGDLPNR